MLVPVGFQYRTDAEQFLREFRERLAKFDLELHADKTRLIEFGCFAARDRKQRGEGKPETFTFLGFTHFCGVHCVRQGATRAKQQNSSEYNVDCFMKNCGHTVSNSEPNE